MDDSGNIFVGGGFEGTMTVGAVNLRAADDSDAFVVKLNGSTHAPVWAVSAGAQASFDYCIDFLPDAGGNVIAVGWGFPPTRYSASGGTLRSFTLPGEDFGTAITAAPDGRIFLGGAYWLGQLSPSAP
jgi:hypothetical protein